MVRKTKEDAEFTRHKIIHAAREVFLAKGVSKTSLEQIASHAGVTRGAVYWHFNNKAELFHAMREQVFLPLIDRMDDTLLNDSDSYASNSIDPLNRIEAFMLNMVKELDENIVTRETYIVMMSKCEYVGDFAIVLQEIMENCNGVKEKLAIAYENARQQNLVNDNLTAMELATDTHLFFSGLLHMWVKDAEGTQFRKQANSLIKTHLKIKRK